MPVQMLRCVVLDFNLAVMDAAKHERQSCLLDVVRSNTAAWPDTSWVVIFNYSAKKCYD